VRYGCMAYEEEVVGRESWDVCKLISLLEGELRTN
jgi:hypothetical protein